MDNDVRNVLNNVCEKDDLTPELSKIYIEVLAVNAVLNRINSNDDVIKNSVSTVNSEFAKRTINVGMDIELFFILIPVESAKIIKEGVIEWISKNEPLQ